MGTHPTSTEPVLPRGIRVLCTKGTGHEWHKLKPTPERQRASVRPCFVDEGGKAGG